MHGESTHPATSRKNCAAIKMRCASAVICSFGKNPRSSFSSLCDEVHQSSRTETSLSFLVSETGDDIGRTWPRDARCSAPEIELSVFTVHVHQPSDNRPCACFLHFQQRVKFVDIACFTAFSPDVRLHGCQTFWPHLTPMRSAFRAFRSRFDVCAANVSPPPRPRRPPKNSQACGGNAILCCLMAGGPTSSKCGLTLTTSVLPLRPSINWKRIDHMSPMWPLFQLSPVCETFRHVLRINRNLDVGLFVDSAEDLDGSPKHGSWNRLSAWHLPSQETSVLQLERCATENLQRKSGHSNCDLSQMFTSVAAASRSVRGYQHIVVGTLIETTTFSTFGSRSILRVRSQGTSRVATDRGQNLICGTKFLRQCHKVVKFFHVRVVDQAVPKTFPQFVLPGGQGLLVATFTEGFVWNRSIHKQARFVRGSTNKKVQRTCSHVISFFD